ncbi:hypothetical protein D3C81_1355100 [compost metagenome]
MATTSVRIPACMRMREASLGIAGRGASGTTAAGAGTTAAGTTVAWATVVAGRLPAICVEPPVIWPLRIAAGDGCPAALPAATTLVGAGTEAATGAGAGGGVAA